MDGSEGTDPKNGQTSTSASGVGFVSGVGTPWNPIVLELFVVTAKAKQPESVPGLDLQQSQILLSPKQGNSAADHTSHFMYRTIPEVFSSDLARNIHLAMERQMSNPDVLMTDVHGRAHIGPQKSVELIVGRINREYSNAVGDNIRNGFFGSLGFIILGDLGSFIGAGVDNAAAAAVATRGSLASQNPTIGPKSPPSRSWGLGANSGTNGGMNAAKGEVVGFMAHLSRQLNGKVNLLNAVGQPNR